MKAFDYVITWMFILAIVTVVVGSGKADKAIETIAVVMQKLIGIITSPQTGTSK